MTGRAPRTVETPSRPVVEATGDDAESWTGTPGPHPRVDLSASRATSRLRSSRMTAPQRHPPTPGGGGGTHPHDVE